MAGNPSHNEIYLLFLDSYAYERSICQDERKIKVIRAYYGRKKAFKCGFGLDTNCEAKGSVAKVIFYCLTRTLFFFWLILSYLLRRDFW